MLSQTDVVVAGIKQMITGGRLAAGSRLPIEKDLATELGVSRGSLREGVRALAMMGVLDTRQGDGTYVTSLDPALLLGPLGLAIELQTPEAGAHLQAVRRVLESEAAFRAAQRADPIWLAEAEGIVTAVDEMIGARGPVDHVRFLDQDVAFHQVVARESGNPVLESLINGLSGRTVRDRMWRAITEVGAEEATQAEHHSILSALRRGDADAARIRMANHLYAVEEFLHAQLDHQAPDDSS